MCIHEINVSLSFSLPPPLQRNRFTSREYTSMQKLERQYSQRIQRELIVNWQSAQ